MYHCWRAEHEFERFGCCKAPVVSFGDDFSMLYILPFLSFILDSVLPIMIPHFLPSVLVTKVTCLVSGEKRNALLEVVTFSGSHVETKEIGIKEVMCNRDQ